MITIVCRIAEIAKNVCHCEVPLRLAQGGLRCRGNLFKGEGNAVQKIAIPGTASGPLHPPIHGQAGIDCGARNDSGG
jgi:hypothetical protein